MSLRWSCCSLWLLRTSFADIYPKASIVWNQGVHNYMLHTMADLPAGTYDQSRLTNIGIGHYAIDDGGGYTYFTPQTGHELSAVLGVTYNFRNPYTDHRNGVDIRLDWAASHFFTQQFHAGIVGYQPAQRRQYGDAAAAEHPLARDRDRPQVGYLFPVGDMQGYLNLKGYFEFDAAHRPEGWNAWLTFALSPRLRPTQRRRRPQAAAASCSPREPATTSGSGNFRGPIR